MLAIAIIFAVIATGCIVVPAKPADESASQPTTTSAPAKVTIDQTSVRALMLTVHQAMEANDYDAVARCADPRVKPATVAMTDMQKATKHLFDVMDKKLGEAAGEFKEHIFFGKLLTSPFASVAVNGKIDWTKVTIEETSDTARILIRGNHMEKYETAKKIDGKWYLVMFGSGSEMSQEQLKEALRQGLGELNVWQSMATKLQKGLDDGSITKDNFYEMLRKLMNESGMSSLPPTQNGK